MEKKFETILEVGEMETVNLDDVAAYFQKRADSLTQTAGENIDLQAASDLRVCERLADQVSKQKEKLSIGQIADTLGIVERDYDFLSKELIEKEHIEPEEREARQLLFKLRGFLRDLYAQREREETESEEQQAA